MAIIKSDLTTGIITVVFGIAMGSLTLSMPEGPAGFPQLIAIGFVMSGSWLVIRYLMARSRGHIALPSRVNGKGKQLLLGVLALWYVLLLSVNVLGLLVPGLVFLVLATWLLLERPGDRKEWMKIIAFSVIFSGVMWLIFGQFLGLEEPGILSLY